MSNTRGERVIAFIEKYIKTPEGKHVGKPLRLLAFQRKFILDVYDNPNKTRRAYLSVGRKNGKTTLIAALLLAHIAGPEAIFNSQIISGAGSRDQAALVYKQAQRMVYLDHDLKRLVKPIPSQKTLIGLSRNVEFKAISAEAGTAHGLSPVVAILDELGQIKGEHSAFVEAIETSQGAYDNPILFAISTQAATDADLFSRWLDEPAHPQIVKHIYTAPADCDLGDRDAWIAANPAMSEFRSVDDLKLQYDRAKSSPADENSFRWLYLNQRIDATAPFVSKAVWSACGGPVIPSFSGRPVYGGLDLSETRDLTALVLVAPVGGIWHVQPTFWLPGEGLRDKAHRDRVPYDIWATQGYLTTTPGKTVDYEYVADYLYKLSQELDLRNIAFDRWNFKHLSPWLLKAGFEDWQVEGDHAIFTPFGQGFASMSPALRDLEVAIVNQKIAHGNNPILEMCAANAVVDSDPAGNRKLVKAKSRGRIDGMIALTMAMSMAGTMVEGDVTTSPWEDPEFSLLA